MPANFSVRNAIFTDLATSVSIFVTTDITIHLYCRVSSFKPQIHSHSIVRRGLPLMSELYFCFISYTDYEQIEAGDTLTHTFSIPSWLPCTTKWCYFYGKKAGVVSKSTSPVFEHHNVYVPPVLIYVGSPAIIRSGGLAAGYPWLSKNHPVDHTGTILHIEVYYQYSGGTCCAALFYPTTGNKYKCRSFANFPITATHILVPVNIPCVLGDFLTIYDNNGHLFKDYIGGVMVRRPSLPQNWPFVGQEIDFNNGWDGWLSSAYGTGQV